MTTVVRYFQLDAGRTILELRGESWLRWDIYDGILSTGIPWSIDDERLTEVSKEEALALSS